MAVCLQGEEEVERRTENDVHDHMDRCWHSMRRGGDERARAPVLVPYDERTCHTVRLRWEVLGVEKEVM